MSVKMIVLFCTVVAFASGALAMWARGRLKRLVARDRARLLAHLRERVGRNVVGGPRWTGWPK